MAARSEDTATTTTMTMTTAGLVKRRGLIAGAAALAAAVATGSASTRVEAVDGSAVLVATSVSPTTSTSTPTRIFNPSSTVLSPLLFGIDNFSDTLLSLPTARIAIAGTTSGVDSSAITKIGVYGAVNTGYGVQGATGAGGIGVFGVTGTGTGIGVIGQSNGNHAVYGNLFGSTAGTAGVLGSGNGSSTYGVSGSNGGGGTAVYGNSTSGIGVYGISGGGGNSPFGVVGAVTSAPGFALYGVASVSGTVGFAAGAGVSGAIAGQFSGPVNIYNNGAIAPGNLFIQGNYTASGTKSAAVPHPDGSHRLLYCMESPEAWFEDFGTGTLAGGKAEVKLDADFAAVVDTSTLHVFPVSHDEAHHLAVKATSAGGFSIAAGVSSEAAARGVKAADVSGTFTYRVVAKRKDVKAARLAKFEIPKAITAAAPVIPTHSTPDKGAPYQTPPAAVPDVKDIKKS